METHHKIAGIIIRERKLLMCRKYNELHFIMPGGRMQEGETPKQTLERELEEELGVKLVSMEHFRDYEAPHIQDKNKIVRMDTYLAEIRGEPRASMEINEIIWLDSNYKARGINVASINQDYLIPELKRLCLID
jgi:8-oxo-dGTP diphosphatase